MPPGKEMGSGSGSGSGSGIPPTDSVPHLDSQRQLAAARKKIDDLWKTRLAEREKEEKEAGRKYLADLHAGVQRNLAAQQAHENRLKQAALTNGPRIVQQARDFLLNHPKAWTKEGTRGAYGPGTNKCNLFVCEVGNAAGLPIPQNYFQGKYPPLAKHWGDPSAVIPGWEVVTSPQPGDVAAISDVGPAPGASRFDHLNISGHVGIVTGPGTTISNSNLAGQVVENDWGFRPDQKGQVVFRRYVGP